MDGGRQCISRMISVHPVTAYAFESKSIVVRDAWTVKIIDPFGVIVGRKIYSLFVSALYLFFRLELVFLFCFAFTIWLLTATGVSNCYSHYSTPVLLLGFLLYASRFLYL